MDEVERDADGNWIDPDDAPEWTEEMAEIAEFSIGGKVIRPASGYLGPNGVVRGQKVTIWLDPEVIDAFRQGGPGWQERINAALRKAAGL